MSKTERESFLKEKNWLLKEKYDGKLTRQALIDIKKLEAGEPVDYLIGFVDFLGCKIDLSYRPLIPRQETEFWVGRVLREVKKENGIFLDIFSGSGCIGLAILKNIANSKVDFSDVDQRAVSQIKKNLGVNKIAKGRYKVVKSDIFKKIKGQYDYIFANPPYIPESRKKEIGESAFGYSVLGFEPHNALFGGPDGLSFIKSFLSEARNHLKKDGVIYMEFDSRKKIAIERLLEKLSYKKYQFFRDQYKRWRYLKVF